MDTSLWSTVGIEDILEEKQFNPALLMESLWVDIWVDNFNITDELMSHFRNSLTKAVDL